jgi:predicted transcriptional regulator
MARTRANRPKSGVVRAAQAKTDILRSTHQAGSQPEAATISGAPDLSFLEDIEPNEETNTGKLSPKAVAREYAAAAEEIETMSRELLDRVKQYEAMSREAHAVTVELNEIATRYRDEAKHVFDHIENCSAVVRSARDICAELKDKILSPSNPAR